jgi:hypothetical protein
MLWSGLRVERIISLAKSSITETAEIINRLAKENQVPRSNIIVDDDGIGGGVTDILTGVKGFINNSKAINGEDYQNLKAQCYYKLSEYINNNEIYIKTTDSKELELIKQELEYVKRARIEKEGKKSIIPKEKVKELIGRSPDYADALMMRMFFNLVKPVDLGLVKFSNPRMEFMREII